MVVFGLLVGVALGWWGARLSIGPSENREPRVMSQADEPDGEEPAWEEDRLYERWLEYLAAAGRRVVPQEVLDLLHVPLLDATGRVTVEAEELFLLTEGEGERLNALIAEVDERLLLAEMEHLEILGMTDDEAIFLIAPFDEGARIEGFLRRGILDILGESDGELFWRMLGRFGMDRWREFGAMEREILFSIRDESPAGEETAAPESRGFWLYYEERVPPDNEGLEDEPWRVEVSRSEFFEPDAESEPFFHPDEERYGRFVPFLPDTLRRRFLGD